MDQKIGRNNFEVAAYVTAVLLRAITICTIVFGEVAEADEAFGSIHILRDLSFARWFGVESVVVCYPGEILKSLDASRDVRHAGFGTFFMQPDISELQRKRLSGAKNDWLGDIPLGIIPGISIAFLRNRSETCHQISRPCLSTIYNRERNSISIRRPSNGFGRKFGSSDGQINVGTQVLLFYVTANADLLLHALEAAKGQDRIGAYEQQREKTDPVLEFAKITILWIAAGWLFYNGLPNRSAGGFVTTLIGLLCFMFGFGLLLHVSETAWSAEKDGSAISCSARPPLSSPANRPENEQMFV
jgi:hypothetical protein